MDVYSTMSMLTSLYSFSSLLILARERRRRILPNNGIMYVATYQFPGFHGLTNVTRPSHEDQEISWK